jgi:hypothetical protein
MKEAYMTEILRSIKENQLYNLKRIHELTEMLAEYDTSFQLQEAQTWANEEYVHNNFIYTIKNKEWIVIFLSVKSSAMHGMFAKCIYNHVYHQF